MSELITGPRSDEEADAAEHFEAGEKEKHKVDVNEIVLQNLVCAIGRNPNDNFDRRIFNPEADFLAEKINLTDYRQRAFDRIDWQRNRTPDGMTRMDIENIKRLLENSWDFVKIKEKVIGRLDKLLSSDIDPQEAPLLSRQIQLRSKTGPATHFDETANPETLNAVLGVDRENSQTMEVPSGETLTVLGTSIPDIRLVESIKNPDDTAHREERTYLVWGPIEDQPRGKTS